MPQTTAKIDIKECIAHVFFEEFHDLKSYI